MTGRTSGATTSRSQRLTDKLRLPRVEFGAEKDGPESAPSPVVTYYLIIVPALVLVVFGLIMGFSASAITTIAADESPYFAFLKPLIIVTFAVVVAAIAQMIPERFYSRLAVAIFAVALVFQFLVRTPLGASEGGNTNWIHIPGVPFLVQPSEFLKLALIMFLAMAVTRPGARITDWKQMAVTAGLPTIIALAFVMLGHDMGTALVMAALAAGTLWVAGLPGRWFIVLILSALPVMAFLVAQNPTRLKRVTDVLPGMGPERSISAPTQVDHAMWALGSGGLTGLGPGASREKWNYLQAAHTDFILAIIGEEFGLLGTLTVLVCLGLMVWGMVRVCQNTASAYARVVAGGVATWIAVQGLINVASVTSLGPVIGVPLPLVSYGGSSLVFTALAVGVVASFARADAGMKMLGRPDEASAGRDPRIAPRKRRAGARTGTKKKSSAPGRATAIRGEVR